MLSTFSSIAQKTEVISLPHYNHTLQGLKQILKAAREKKQAGECLGLHQASQQKSCKQRESGIRCTLY